MNKTESKIKTYALLEPTEKNKLNGGERMDIFERVMLAELNLRPVDYVVYGFLFRHANYMRLKFYDEKGKATDKGHGYYIGTTLDIMLRALPIGKKVLIDSLQRLEESGVVTVMYKATKQDRKGSCYRLNTDITSESWQILDTPKLHGTEKKRGKGVKDRWQFFNDLYGVMGSAGWLRDKKIDTTSAALLLIIFGLSKWKRVEGMKEDMPGWYATLNKKDLANHLHITRRTLDRNITKLFDLGLVANITGDIFLGHSPCGSSAFLLCL